MINTVVNIVKRFGTSSKHFLLKFYLNFADTIHCNLNDFISFHLVFLFCFCFFGGFFVAFFVNKNYFENGLWKVRPNI